MSAWIAFAEGGAQAVKTLLDPKERNKIISFINYLIKENRVILLFGTSGSGKTQFIKSLNNSVEQALRTHKTKRHKIPIKNMPLKFIDTPGHTEYVNQRRKEIDKIINKGVEGIINIVSYGYNDQEELSDFKVFDVNGKLSQGYLSDNRHKDIMQLKEWLPRISNKNVKWIVNLITKADIWWDDLPNAEHYYTKGDYGKQFKRHKENMTIINMPYCSTLKSFRGRINSTKFGDPQRVAIKEHFLEEFFALMEKE
jgi:energy-coupling factor transporter ATP-binding protein EcfA2